MRNKMMSLIFLALSAALPAMAQTTAPTNPNSNTDEPTRLNNTQVDFVDSRDAYWITRGFNDMIYGANGGVLNEAHIERNHDRDEETMKKIYKPNQVVQQVVIINAKKTVTPAINVNGTMLDVNK